MNRILVTGASGFLGWNFCRLASAYWEVHGFYQKNKLQIGNVSLHKMDLTDFQAVTRFISELHPKRIFHLAACSDPNFCQNNPAISRKVNVTATVHLGEICEKMAIPMIFISSDLVFSGKTPPYSEKSPVSPISFYGEQKVEAEKILFKMGTNITICRAPLMFGDCGPGSGSFIQPMVKTLTGGQEMDLFLDEVRTPLSGLEASRGIIKAVAHQGLCHLPGPQRISRFDFGVLLCEHLGVDSNLIRGCRREDKPMAAPRPADVSLTSKIEEPLKTDTVPLRAQIKETLLSMNRRLL